MANKLQTLLTKEVRVVCLISEMRPDMVHTQISHNRYECSEDFFDYEGIDLSPEAINYYCVIPVAERDAALERLREDIRRSGVFNVDISLADYDSVVERWLDNVSRAEHNIVYLMAVDDNFIHIIMVEGNASLIERINNGYRTNWRDLYTWDEQYVR